MNTGNLLLANFARTKGAKDRKKRKSKILSGAVAGALTGVTAASTPVMLARVAKKYAPKRFKAAVGRKVGRGTTNLLRSATSSDAVETAGAAGTLLGAGLGARAAMKKDRKKRNY